MNRRLVRGDRPYGHPSNKLEGLQQGSADIIGYYSYSRALAVDIYFDIIGNMEQSFAVTALAALAQDSRLAIFRYLVGRGPEGAAAGLIGATLGLPLPTLSFHLGQLKQAQLVRCQRAGRSLIYAAEFTAMNGLVAYLTENCCGGRPDLCAPACAPGECDPATETEGANDGQALPRKSVG